MKLGEIKSVYENADPTINPIMYTNAKMDLSSVGATAAISPNIQSGQNEIKVDVTLVYEVK